MPRRNPKTVIDVASLARAHTELCIKRLAGIVNQSNDQGAVIAASRVLFERGWGKAPETITLNGSVTHELGVDAMAVLLGRIDAISGRLPPVIEGDAVLVNGTDADPSGTEH